MARRYANRANGGPVVTWRLRRNPVRLCLIVLVPRRRLQPVLCRIHRQVPRAVLVRRPNGIEWNRHVLRVDSEKATDRNDEGVDLALIANQHVDDLADLAVGRVVDVLLVLGGHGGGIRGYCGQD
jgi:hypothetical protein